MTTACNVVASSGWVEYFLDGANADFFAPAIQDESSLIVPSLAIFEVFKKILREGSEGAALQAAATMSASRVVDLSSELALLGARLSLEHRLPMADSAILATARSFEATLWTQDIDFEGLEGVRFTPAAKGR